MTWSRKKIVYSAIAVFALVPLPQVVAPAWTVKTLDAAHKPLSGITVRESWQQYSFENESHEEDRLSDGSGKVHFARRIEWSSFGFRFAGCAWQVVSAGVHASCGANSYLVAFGDGIGTTDWQSLRQMDGTALWKQNSTLISTH